MRRAALAALAAAVAACGGGDSPPVMGMCHPSGGCPVGYSCHSDDDQCWQIGALPPGSGPVTVTVYDFGSPQQGASVLYQTADGATIALVATGADGTAVHDLPDGGGITVAQEQAGGRALTTIVGVHPNVGLIVGLPPPPASNVVGHTQVTLPGTYATAFDYYIDGTCGQSSTTTTPDPEPFDVYSDCLGANGKLAVLAAARDVAGEPLAFSGAKGVTVGGGTTSVNLPAWAAATDVTVTLGGVPATGTLRLSLQYGLGGISFAAPERSVVLSAAGSQVFHVPAPLALSDTFPYWARVVVDNTTLHISSESSLISSATPAATEAIDLSGLLPRPTSYTLDQAAPARPRVSFQTSTTLGEAVVEVEVDWDDTVRGGLNSWTLIGPSATSTAAPPLPEELADWRPPDTGLTLAWLDFWHSSAAPTYAAFLHDVHAVLIDFGRGGYLTGTQVYVSITQPM